MQTLDPINVGQAPNDGTGDDHRKAFQKVNANFDKAVEGIAEVGEAAQAASDTAAAAIPATEKGVAGGVASLDAEGKIPAQYLPEDGAFIPLAQKGVAEGVATLGEDGKVTPGQLPNAVDAIPLAEKGQAGGVATLDADGLVPETQLPPIPSGPAVGTPDWWPLRSSIPAGQIPQDGQTVSRATYPELTAMVLAGTLPVVAEATWQSTPTERGKYTVGDGSTTIRLPDLNGKSAGSLGAVFRRGDGSLSAGAGGLIQRDAMQGHHHDSIRITGLGVTAGGLSANNTNGTGPFVGADLIGNPSSDGLNGTPRTAAETRSLNVTGVWTVHAFGEVVNPGSVDAAQLASDLATLQAAFQALSSSIGFTVIYPGGSAASPGILLGNSQQIIDNPFPGFAVHVAVEVLLNLTNWHSPGWLGILDRTVSPDPFLAWGVTAAHRIQNDKIVVTAGKNGTTTVNPNMSGGSLAVGEIATNQVNAYFRLKVWKLRGLSNA
ncbi:phage tail protein [Achromobacter mucicolens]|uniref:phage tail protein n=1 Tax=Achromobacter mucicolens TaxID=1389922 RepID=UPI002898C3A2|nr:phage tail protein [Achromobacter mucicolens]